MDFSKNLKKNISLIIKEMNTESEQIKWRNGKEDLQIAATFCENNYLSYWDNLKRSKTNLHFTYFMSDGDCRTFIITDYDNYDDPEQNIILSIDVDVFNPEIDLYELLTNQFQNLYFNIEDNPILWEDYLSSFKLKWNDIIDLNLFKKNCGIDFACQKSLKKYLFDNKNPSNKMQYAFTLYTWIGCTYRSLENNGYPMDIINFLLDCMNMYGIESTDSYSIEHYANALGCLNFIKNS